MLYELYTYFLYFLLAYIIWVLVTKFMGVRGDDGGTAGGGGEGGTGGGDDGTGEGDGGTGEGGGGAGGGGGGGAGEGEGDSGTEGGDDGTGESDDGAEGEGGTGGGGGGDGEGDGGSGGDGDEPDDPTGGGSQKDNLLKNNCGQEQLEHWRIMVNGGDGWIVEKIPIGANPLPKRSKEGIAITDFGVNTSCFATSGDFCMKEQVIDLLEEGFSEKELDSQPSIEVSEWYACHADSDGHYLLNVTLLNQDKENMHSFMHMENFNDVPKKEWYKISNTFSKVEPGVRYVSFNHGGQSSPSKPGHFGSKMSGGVVRVLPLRVTDETH